jgi:hypothetical protein
VGLLTLSPLVLPPPPSLLLGGAATDLLVLGSGSSIDDLDPFTILFWLNPTTLTGGRTLFRKAGTGIKVAQVSGTSGDIQVQIQRAGGFTNYTTNSTPLAPTGTWIFLAITYNSGASAGQVHNVYKGTLSAPATECTYGTASDSSGATLADAAGDLHVCGRGGASNAFQGPLASTALLNRELSLAEIRFFQWLMLEWRSDPVIYPGLVAAHAYGVNGSGTQRDLTGNKNDGTVTGATVNRGIVRPARQRIVYVQTDPPSGGDVATPSPAVSTWTANDATVSLGGVTAAPSSSVATWTASDPTVSLGGVTAAPTTATATWTANDASVATGSVTASPSPAATTWTASDPTVSVGGVTALPSPAVASWTASDPSISVGGVSASPSPATSTWTALDPTAGANLVGNADPAISTWTANDPSVSLGGVSVAPSPASSTWSNDAPTVALGGVAVAPAPATSTWAALAATFGVAASVANRSRTFATIDDTQTFVTVSDSHTYITITSDL